MSLIAQVVLGHLLSVETYAVFAAATVALTLVSGFQNAGVNKNLIQQQEHYDSLIGDFTVFSLYLGVVASAFLIINGMVLAWLYDMPHLVSVVAISAIALPITSLNWIYTAVLGIRLRFDRVSKNTILYSFAYYSLLMLFAYLGASYYSVAAATLLSVVIQHINHRTYIGWLPVNWRISRQRFFAIFVALRWTIIASFLMGLSQNGNFFALGHLLTSEELGYYFFGFMLTANASVLVFTAINQTLLPIFSKMKGDEVRLRLAFLRSSGVLNFLCSILCLGLIGVGPAAVHFIWGGKWDAAIFTSVVTAATFPIRIFTSIATVTLESRGRWRSRTLLLAFDAATVILFAAVGAWLAGLSGAALSVAIQRGVVGLITYPMVARVLGYKWRDVMIMIGKSVAPFALAAAVLFFGQPAGSSPVGISDTAVAAIETAGAILLYIAVTYVVSRETVMELPNLLRRRRA
ncbi:oligosaccharide flippase family protein [Ancylobacter sp. 6x-1]|uniref:Oligosaccharide flippase family protein n=2 Tax=Ancylobacter crimeensis TaxID=2579147 RepID=A0ABT0D6M4_9HYPH|nr:oligosaccharide flippase family protein [Ancylobacter crimeensis]